MFKLNENYEIGRRSIKCDKISSFSAETSTVNTTISQICINIRREASIILLTNTSLDLNVEVNKKADFSRFADDFDTKLVILRPITSFSKNKLTTSSGKPLQVLSYAHIVTLKYNLLTSAKDTGDPSTGCDRDCVRRQREAHFYKNTKGKYHVRIMLKDVLGCGEHQKIYFWARLIIDTNKK